VGHFSAELHAAVIRIVRSIMLKGSNLSDLRYDAIAMFVLMLIAMTIAVTLGRSTKAASAHVRVGS
jgi:hypothetical protein